MNLNKKEVLGIGVAIGVSLVVFIGACSSKNSGVPAAEGETPKAESSAVSEKTEAPDDEKEETKSDGGETDNSKGCDREVFDGHEVYILEARYCDGGRSEYNMHLFGTHKTLAGAVEAAVRLLPGINPGQNREWVFEDAFGGRWVSERINGQGNGRGHKDDDDENDADGCRIIEIYKVELSD